MSFTGNPGSGKTAVAKRMALLLHRLGYIQKGHFFSITRNEIVGQYIGHTAPKTKSILKRAIGGILFIDEAYSLYRPDNEKDYGSEAIEILLQVMENQRTNLIVIFAGYREKMNIFYESNPGLASRVAHHINFPNYDLFELSQIARIVLKRHQYQLNISGENVLLKYFKKRMKLPFFANAQTVTKTIDIARMKHASQLFIKKAQTITKENLVTLRGNDIYNSSLLGNLARQY